MAHIKSFNEERIKLLKYIFFSLVVSVSALMCYVFSSTQGDAVFTPFSGLRSYERTPSNTTRLFKDERKPEMGAVIALNVYNRTIQKKNYSIFLTKGKPLKLTTSNFLPKRYFLCSGPTGRLGNQLFDFASSLGIAKTLNYTFMIRSTNPLLKLFKINQLVLTRKPDKLRIITLQQWRNNWWGRDGSYHAYNLTLYGFFRLWNYFKHITSEVRKSLTIKDGFLYKAKRFLQLKTPRNRTLIGVHIRRGDFLREKLQAFGKAVASKKYITAAMTYYKERYNDPFFVVVSDDKRWCKANLTGPDVVVSENKEPIVDLAIMTLCQHTIITSGTFGWWGGWLAGGEVVYWTGFPKPGSKNEKEILFKGEFYPPHWIGIDSD